MPAVVDGMKARSHTHTQLWLLLFSIPLIDYYVINVWALDAFVLFIFQLYHVKCHKITIIMTFEWRTHQHDVIR